MHGFVTDVLVIPTRHVPRIADLTPPELSSLMTSVQHVGRVVERVYGADGLTIACQVSRSLILKCCGRPMEALGWESCWPDNATRPFPYPTP